MRPPRIILSTCGTSILNFDQPPEVRKWLIDNANKKVLAHQDRARLEEIAAAQRQRLGAGLKPELYRASAELSCIDLLLARYPTDRVRHILLHTDTAAGRSAGELVRELGLPAAELCTIDGLRTDQADVFRDALSGLTDYLEKRLTGCEHPVIFNLAGGFKSMSAYLQALGMLYADLCVFLFERSAEIMEIPRLPVRLMGADEFRSYLTVFRKLNAGYPVTTGEAASIPEALLLGLDGQVTRSVWGDVFWNRLKKGLLCQNCSHRFRRVCNINMALSVTSLVRLKKDAIGLTNRWMPCPRISITSYRC